MPNTAADMIYLLGQVAEKRAPKTPDAYQRGYLQTLLIRVLNELSEDERQKFIEIEMCWLGRLLNENV